MTRLDSIPAVLERARDLVGPSLRRAVERLSPEVRPLASYHLGWSDADGRPSGGDGGKGVRPALALLSAEAVGAPSEFGVPGGVAIELVHNFSLIHDDVIDEDAERRHRPTIWSLFGIGRAVIVGDAMLALAQQVLLDPGILALAPEVTADPLASAAAARCIADATAAMIAGQALDMAFEAVPSVDVAGCLAMEAGKTGALLSCASSVGALLAGAPAECVDALARFGMELGLAFQAVDDLLGIWGDPVATGKPAYSDLHQHKKSLPVAAALAAGGPSAEELARLLAEPSLDDAAVARAAGLVEACGGRDVAEAEARSRFAAALGALDGAPLEPGARDELSEVAGFVVERRF
jgi:geranylgeranyl diphosphate synthase type I